MEIRKEGLVERPGGRDSNLGFYLFRKKECKKERKKEIKKGRKEEKEKRKKGI